MNSAKQDAIRDMACEGVYKAKPCNTLKISDVIDPIVINGLTPRRLFDQKASGYIDFKQGTIGLIGALALGLDSEKTYPSRWTLGLIEFLSDKFGVSEHFLEGAEAGFEGWREKLADFSHLLSREFKDGFAFGERVWAAYRNAPVEM